MEEKKITKRKKKKISPLMLTRRLVQLAAFALFPGLFIATFAALKSICTAIIGGTFSAAALAGQIVLAASMLVITALMGRFFCGFLCAFGSMGDLLWYIGGKLKIKRPKISPRADRVLKSVKYILLAGIVLFVWMLGAPALNGTANPWTVFGMYAGYKGWADLSALWSLGALLLLLIMAGSMLIERFFCRYLCPLGAVFAIVSKFRLFRIRKPRRSCGPCRACTKRCPMGIPLYKGDAVTSAECIDCMSCVDICPRGNVSANLKPAVAAAVAVAAMSVMYFAANLTGTAAAETLAAAAVAETPDTAGVLAASGGIYTDGVYTGSASGYHGATSVRVTVENGYITAVEVLSTGDDAEFFNMAQCRIIPAIVTAQSVDVDAVSGATFSSNAITGAVSDALSGALNGASGVTLIGTDDEASAAATPELTPTPAPEATATPESTGVPETAGPFGLADGVYTGTGTGYRGETEVSVTIENGYITEIVIDAYGDDEPYFQRAKSTVLSAILTAQSPDVDAVSGATYSSNGIMEAVADALNAAFTAETPSSGGQNRRGHN